MAEVISGSDLTIIVLTSEEAEALADLLEVSDPEDNMVLDELTNALVGLNNKHWDVSRYFREGYEPVVTNWDKPEPSWKDEPTSDYRFGRG